VDVVLSREDWRELQRDGPDRRDRSPADAPLQAATPVLTAAVSSAIAVASQPGYLNLDGILARLKRDCVRASGESPRSST
jgi:hypothetical protein